MKLHLIVYRLIVSGKDLCWELSGNGTGDSIGMTGRELDQFADAFEHPERTAARRVIG